MSLATVAEVRALVDSDLSDADLQVVIDRAEAELVAQTGPNYADGEITEALYPAGAVVYLSRAAETITSVTEYGSLAGSAAGTVLTTDSYHLDARGGLLRLAGNWPARVVVVYTPADDTARRKAVLIELVRLDLAPAGMESESIRLSDGTSYSYNRGGGAEQARARLFQRLRGLRA